jgi:hypothetical protein
MAANFHTKSPRMPSFPIRIATSNLKLSYELDTPTIAPEVPIKNKRWNDFSVTNAISMKAKLTYFKLNSQTACPPRTAVPVNQGCCGGSFTLDTRIAFGHGCDLSSYVRDRLGLSET